MSGITLEAYGDTFHQFIVSNVDPNSPGEKAGFKEGDQIMMIDGVSAFQFTLSDLDRLFKSGDNKKVHLGFYRQGYYFDSLLILKKRI